MRSDLRHWADGRRRQRTRAGRLPDTLAVVAFCLWATHGLAAEGPAGNALRLHYTARLHGVSLLGADYCLRMSATSYESTLAARTLGLVDILVHAQSRSRATGAILPGDQVAPHDFSEQSRLSGEDYAIALGYDGDTPRLLHALPSQEKYRRLVPSGLLAHSIDGLGAVVLQSLAATHRGQCASETVYDGRQVRRLATQSGGRDILKPNTHSVFAGEALRCDTVSTTLAGFLKAETDTAQAVPRHGTLWLGPAIAGGDYVPVRMRFDAAFLGDVIVDLDATSHGDGCP